MKPINSILAFLRSLLLTQLITTNIRVGKKSLKFSEVSL